MRVLKKFLYSLIAVVLIALFVSCTTRPQHNGAKTDHFDGRSFISPSYNKKSFGDLLKWQLTSDKGPWQQRPLSPGLSAPIERSDSLRITLINHSTVLIQVGGINILTDPIWSDRTGPWGKLGPRRFRQPGIALSKLPPIDAVLVSHSHYDHMDLPTLAQLAQTDDPVFIVGLANAKNLAKVNITNVVELDWWQSHALSPSVSVHGTPAAHWSKRTLFDTNKTLWLGYAITQNQQHRAFFAGDTGPGKHFEQIRQRFGASDVALLPIGAYLPQWFMQDNHISPVQALQAAKTLDSDVMIPIHFGTFALGDDGQDQPLADLLTARSSFPEISIKVLDNGQHTDL